MQALRGAGAAINKATSDGSTALIRAARCGHEAAVQGLLGAGTAVAKAMSDGSTPLVLSAERGHKAVVCALLGAGADVSKSIIQGGLRSIGPLLWPHGGGAAAAGQ